MVGLRASERTLGRFFWVRRGFLVTLNRLPTILLKKNLDSRPLPRVLREAKGHSAGGRNEIMHKSTYDQ